MHTVKRDSNVQVIFNDSTLYCSAMQRLELARGTRDARAWGLWVGAGIGRRPATVKVHEKTPSSPERS
jgi:hypothetical protein